MCSCIPFGQCVVAKFSPLWIGPTFSSAAVLLGINPLGLRSSSRPAVENKPGYPLWAMMVALLGQYRPM